MLDVSFCVSWSDFVQTVNEKLEHGLEDDTLKSNKVEICVDEDVVKKVGFTTFADEALNQTKAHYKARGKNASGIHVEYQNADLLTVAGDDAKFAIIRENGSSLLMVSNLHNLLRKTYPDLEYMFRRVCEAVTELMRTECRTENLERWAHKESIVSLCLQRTVNHELAFFAKSNPDYDIRPSTFIYSWDIYYQDKHLALSLDGDLFNGCIGVSILDCSAYKDSGSKLVLEKEILEFEKVNEHND